MDLAQDRGKRKKAIHAIILVIWCIWRRRNESMFRSASPDPIKVLDEVKSMAYLWLKNRLKEASITWDQWSRFSFFG
ncbi:hypothetical protein HanRHA438_Chr09g0391051 [Helianthus annuus]|nr:hypothetical protein HanRHA438_Chr09g0391051 [Helianthus annuus]